MLDLIHYKLNLILKNFDEIIMKLMVIYKQVLTRWSSSDCVALSVSLHEVTLFQASANSHTASYALAAFEEGKNGIRSVAEREGKSSFVFCTRSW